MIFSMSRKQRIKTNLLPIETLETTFKQLLKQLIIQEFQTAFHGFNEKQKNNNKQTKYD